MLIKAFPFKIQTVQTDNETEFTYKYISDTQECPFDEALRQLEINHKLIPPKRAWHNGKVERSHRNDQRYFYDWETFRNVDELNKKLQSIWNGATTNPWGLWTIRVLNNSWRKSYRHKFAVFARLFRSATLHSKGGQKHSSISLLYFLPKMGHISLQRREVALKSSDNILTKNLFYGTITYQISRLFIL